MTTLMSNAEAAKAIGIEPGTLRVWRCQGRGPKFVKLTSDQRGRCGYDPSDIEAWKAERKFKSTSAAAVHFPEPPAPPSAPVIRPWERSAS